MTLRIAMIGCGAVARRYHLSDFKRFGGVDVVAFASRSLASASAAASDWGGGETFSDWRKVLDLDVDAVDICSPNAVHREQAIAAAERGKHVLVEKPMATTVEEADDMIAAATAAGVVLRVAHNVRYLPPAHALKQAVGKVGNIVGVRSVFGHAGPSAWAPDATWFFDRTMSGGGALIDLGIHAIDLLRFVTGLDVVEVAAMTVGSEQVEDAAQVLLRFDNGAAGSLHASWVARPGPDFGLTIFGTEGMLHLDAATPPTFRSAAGETKMLDVPKPNSSPYEDFALEVSGKPPRGDPASPDDGRAALAVVCAAYESARTGQTVTL